MTTMTTAEFAPANHPQLADGTFVEKVQSGPEVLFDLDPTGDSDPQAMADARRTAERVLAESRTDAITIITRR